MSRLTALALALATGLAPALHAQTPVAPAASPALVPAAGNPNLSVASVRMADGVRASKVIGATVTGSDNTDLASVNDLMMNAQHQVVYAILSVGAVMGIGGKLVAVPVGQLQPGSDGKLTLAGGDQGHAQCNADLRLQQLNFV